jgi:putative redox protein
MEKEVIASAEWKQGMLFDGRSQSGHTVHFDATAEHASGPSPMEAVLAALCGCTAVDVVSILQKKREPLEGLTVEAVAEQAAAPPRVFTHIQLTYRIRGKISRKAAEDAVALSKNKYCSVSKMLEKAATIEYSIEQES